MYSQLFCGSIDSMAQDSSHIKDDDFCVKLYKVELIKFQELCLVAIDFLSIDERNRAKRYHFLKDKNRFIICRFILKFLLAEYTGLGIDKILIDIDSNKKPYLSSHPSVFFNVSHSGEWALIAIAKTPIGIDVEYVNTSFEYEEILPTIFNKPEINEIKNSKDNHHAFFKFWTRKEAIVKAIGKGIDDDIKKICATDGLHSLPLTMVGNFKQINAFSFNVNENYMGAIALTGSLHSNDNIVFCELPYSDELLFMINSRK